MPTQAQATRGKDTHSCSPLREWCLETSHSEREKQEEKKCLDSDSRAAKDTVPTFPRVLAQACHSNLPGTSKMPPYPNTHTFPGAPSPSTALALASG